MGKAYISRGEHRAGQPGYGRPNRFIRTVSTRFDFLLTSSHWKETGKHNNRMHYNIISRTRRTWLL